MIKRSYGSLKILDSAGAPEQSKSLEEKGYAIVRQGFSEREINELRADIERVFADTKRDNRGGKRDPISDNMHRFEMVNKSALVQKTAVHRSILDVLEPILGNDCHVASATSWRNPKNQEGAEKGGNWHTDAGPHIPRPEGITWPDDIPYPIFVVGVHILLMDSNLEDGPTGVVPGSHRSGRFVPFKQNFDSELEYEGAKCLAVTGKSGDVLFFSSDIWHRRMPTRPGQNGRFFHQFHYSRRDMVQRIRTTDQVNHLSEDAKNRIESDRERTVLGLHPGGFYDGG